MEPVLFGPFHFAESFPYESFLIMEFLSDIDAIDIY
jgi:hypothetical protein